MLRFVVLTHDHPDWHWDLMLESNGVLRTWRLNQEPTLTTPIEATPLPDHRLKYLAYEGPVSGQRGHVLQWDHGQYQLLQESRGILTIDLQGDKLRGQATLTSTAEGAVWFQFVPQEP
jgi:hypothetical protein